jgi:hypothetical protein
MFCEDCKIEVPPAWVLVIERNICPACGGEIMSAASKELLDELTAAMAEMEHDPAGLAGWLLSNYQLKKVGDGEPTGFNRGRPANHGLNQNFPGLKVAENPKSIFLKRAGMARELAKREVSRKEHLASLSDQIDADGNLSVNLDEIDEYQDLDEYEALALMQAEQSSKSAKLLANNGLIVQGNAPPPSPEEAAQLAAALGGETSFSPDSDLPPALQADRFKRLRAQQEVAAGGSPKPGSFSRG